MRKKFFPCVLNVLNNIVTVGKIKVSQGCFVQHHSCQAKSKMPEQNLLNVILPSTNLAVQVYSSPTALLNSRIRPYNSWGNRHLAHFLDNLSKILFVLVKLLVNIKSQAEDMIPVRSQHSFYVPS